MGLFSFIKEIGKKFTGDSAALDADALKRELDSYKLGTEDVQVSLQGDKVVLAGEVKDQTAFEKALLALGNVAGVAAVQADGLKVAAAAAAEPTLYTVKSGDNLWKIAEAHYGKGKGDKNPLIFEANRPMLTSPDKIYPGQVLRIPPLA